MGRGKCGRCTLGDLQKLASQCEGHVVVKVKKKGDASAGGNDVELRGHGGYDVFIRHPEGSLVWAAWVSELTAVCVCRPFSE